DPITTTISSLSLHDALPIWQLAVTQGHPDLFHTAAKTARREHDNGEEDQPHVENRGIGVITEHGVHQGHHDGANNRAIEHTHARSGEHTSELQSRFDLVCRL